MVQVELVSFGGMTSASTLQSKRRVAHANVGDSHVCISCVYSVLLHVRGVLNNIMSSLCMTPVLVIPAYYLVLCASPSLGNTVSAFISPLIIFKAKLKNSERSNIPPLHNNSTGVALSASH